MTNWPRHCQFSKMTCHCSSMDLLALLQVWVTVPVLIYMSERMLRGVRRRLWKTQVLGLRVLPGSVVALRLSKSAHFSFR